MAQGDLRLSVWSRPGASPFEQKDLAPPGPFSATKRMAGGIGRGQLTVPVNYDRINELIKRTPGDPGTDVRRLARVYAEGVTLPVYEFFLDNTSDEAVETDTTISGAGVESLLADGIVYPWDWDGEDVSESSFPDWVWGGRELVGPVETSFAPHITSVWTDAASGSFQFGVSINGGGFVYATINVGDSAFNVEQAVEGLSNVDTADVEGSGTVTNPWQIKILTPSGTYTTALGSQSLTGGRAYIALEQFGKLTPIGWTESRVGSTTIGHGILTDFRASLGGGSDPVLPAECSAWVVFLGQEWYFPGVQKIVKVLPGGIVQAPSLYLYAQGAAATLRVVVRDLNEKFIAAEEITVPSNTLISTVGMVNILVPAGITEVVFRIGHIGAGTPPRIFVGCPSLREGLAPTSAGGIFSQLFTDATVSHVFDGRIAWENLASPGTTYLDLSFTTAVDSAGVAWNNMEMDFTAKRGKNHQQVMQDLNNRGYRWSVTPSNTDGRWFVNLYNPTWVKVDATALQSPAINVGSGVTSGPIVRSHLTGNAITVEGDQLKFARSLSAASVAAIGRREVYQPDRTITTTDAASVRAAQEVASRLLSGLSVALNIDPVNSPIPLVDYDVDWQLNVQVPPALPKSAHRVAAITFDVAAETKYSVSFSSESFTGPAGVIEGTRRLLEKYEGFEREAPDSFPTPISSGIGTMPTITFAASDSLPMDKAKADHVCPGTFGSGASDGQFMQGLTNAAAAAGTVNGRVVLLSGHYSMEVVGAVGYALKLPPDWGIEGQTGYGPFNAGPVLEGYTQTGTPGATDTVLLLNGTSMVRGLTVTGSSEALWAIRSPAGSVAITDCYVSNSLGIYCAGQEVWVQRNRFFANEDRDVTFDSVQRGWITDNRHGNNQGHGIHILDGGTQLTIRNNVLVSPGNHGIYLSGTTGPEETFILYNSITTAGFVVANGSGIVSDQTNPAQQLWVVGNEIEVPDQDGIRIKDYLKSIIAFNSVREAQRDAIHLEDVQDSLVFGNTLHEYAVAGIILHADSDENYISHNILRSVVPPTYGIRVDDTTCNANIVIANDLRGAGGTAYSDNGTGTLNLWPAGAAGDNFV